MYVLYTIVKFHINLWWTIPKIWLPNYVLFYVGLSSKKYGWKTVLLPSICYLLLAVNVWGSSAHGMLNSWWLVTLQSAVNNPSPPFAIVPPPHHYPPLPLPPRYPLSVIIVKTTTCLDHIIIGSDLAVHAGGDVKTY